jgi:hypothetical protein
MTEDSPGPRSHSITESGIATGAARSSQRDSVTDRTAGSLCVQAVTSSKTVCGTMTRDAPARCNKSICPALPRKISGDALTTRCQASRNSRARSS